MTQVPDFTFENRNLKVRRDTTPLEITKGNVEGHAGIQVTGQNPDIDIADGFAHIWPGKLTGTQRFVAPTQARIHDIVSSDVADAGAVLVTGTVDSATVSALVASAGDFIANGVTIGDVVVDDTKDLIAQIVAVSDSTLTIANWFNPNDGLRQDTPSRGDVYRVATATGIGTGMVHIQGLDASFLQIEEFVVINGTTSVPTVKLYTRMNTVRAMLPGSSPGELVGAVTFTAQTDGTVTASIVDGDNVSLQAHFTVPIDKDAHAVCWTAGVAKKTAGVASVRLTAGQISGIMYVIDQINLNSSASTNITKELGLRRFPGGIDIFIEADVDTNSMSVTAGISLILVDI